MLASPTVGSELSDLHTRRHRHTHTLCQGGNAPLQISAHLAQHTTPTAQQSLPCRKHLVRKRRRNCTAKCTHSHTFTHTYTVGTYSPYCSATLNHTHSIPYHTCKRHTLYSHSFSHTLCLSRGQTALHTLAHLPRR